MCVEGSALRGLDLGPVRLQLLPGRWPSCRFGSVQEAREVTVDQGLRCHSHCYNSDRAIVGGSGTPGQHPPGTHRTLQVHG